jgi:hypothetical protein
MDFAFQPVKQPPRSRGEIGGQMGQVNVNTPGDGAGSSAAVIAMVVVVLIVAILLILWLTGAFRGTATTHSEILQLLPV